jgi:hypothetical protein
MNYHFYQLFLDLDGVLADFDSGFFKMAGKKPHDLPKRDMWKAIAANKTFFEDLDLMPDGLELWNYVEKHNPKILTGLPTVNDGANQKKRWVAKTISQTTEVLVVASKEKFLHSGYGKILIDDRQDMITPWIAAGGIGILHTSTKNTIDILQTLNL